MMTPPATFQQVAAQLQVFKEIERKEQFLFILEALVARLISGVGWATRFTVAHQILQKSNGGQQKDVAYPTPTVDYGRP